MQYQGNIVGDVFSLSTVYDEQVKNVENNNFGYWRESSIYAYLGGGGLVPTNSNWTNIYRYNFSTDVFDQSPTRFLPTARSRMGAISDPSYGHFAGGFVGGGTAVSTITRLNFSTDNCSNPGTFLPTARSQILSVAGRSYGYFAGGSSPNGLGPFFSNIIRIDYSSQSTSILGINLPSTTSLGASVFDGNNGYFGGGGNPNPITTISRLNFLVESVSLPGNNFPSARSWLGATSSASYGYFFGGLIPGTPALISTISRLDFSNDTLSNLTNTIPGSTTGGSASANFEYAYYKGTGSAFVRLNFSDETVDNPSARLPGVVESATQISGGQSL